MKIFKADKFQSEKRSKIEGLNSATPEAKEEDTRIDEELENQSADEFADQNVSPDPELQTQDESPAKGDAEPEGASNTLSRAFARKQSELEPEILPEPQPGETSEKSPHNEAQPQNLTDHGMQTSFESIPEKKSEPLSKNMDLSDRLSDQEPTANLEHMPPEEQPTNFTPEPGQEQAREENQKSMGIGEVSIKHSAFGRKLRRFDLKAVSKPDDQRKERPKRKKKDTGGGGGDITEPPRYSLRDAFHIIFKRKLQILLCFFFIMLIVIVATLLMKPVYEASAQILVKLGRESVFVPTAGNVTPILNINREEQVNSEIEILKSRSLAEKVVAAMGPTVLYKSLGGEKSAIFNLILQDKRQKMTPAERKVADFESAVAEFMKAINVFGIKKSNVIQVSFKNEDPQVAAAVVNQLANMYLEHHLSVHKAPQNVRFFKEQTDLLKNKLEQTEEKLKALRKQHNITSLEQQRTLLLGRSSELNAGLNQTISLEVETEKRIHQLRLQLASLPETISQGVENDQNPYLMNTLEARLVELQLKEKELLTKYTDESRLVQNVKEEISVVQKKLKEQATKSYGSRTSVVNPTYQKLKEELLRNETEIEALKAKKIAQEKHLDDIQRNLENLNQVELELKQLEQEIEVDHENYKLYLTKVEESRISDAMDSEKIASVSVIGPARPPRKPVSPKVLLNILIGIFLGIFGSLSLALFREYLDDRIEKIEDVEKELQLPVLASIPLFEQKAARGVRF